MTNNQNPGAKGATGASAGDLLGSNRSKNTKPTISQQGRSARNHLR